MPSHMLVPTQLSPRSSKWSRRAQSARRRQMPPTSRLSWTRLQKQLHLFGRYGVTMFALSVDDIALWDLAAKAEGKPVSAFVRAAASWQLFRPMPSLLPIVNPKEIARECKQALAKGYTAIKLHETTVGAARSGARGDWCRCAFDGGLELSDGCGGPHRFCNRAAGLMRRCFFEEPVWPPEDFRALARVQATGGIPPAAGEMPARHTSFANCT